MGFDDPAKTLGNMQTLLAATGRVAGSLQTGTEDTSAQDELEDMARLAELDARENARQERAAAKEDAEALRREQQRRKAKARTLWGKSGVGMAGSPLRIMEGMANESEQEIRARIDEGEDRAGMALSQGKARAESYRDRASGYGSTGGIDPFAAGSSILGLGKTLFELKW